VQRCVAWPRRLLHTVAILYRFHPSFAVPESPRKCIFCEGRPLSKEHVWADWFRNYIPRTQREHRVSTELLHPTEATQTVVIRRQGDTHSRTVKCVCIPCNNEWMSQLQEQAKPLIEPMLLGKPVRFHRKAQTVLSAWAAMTVMCAEYINEEMISISPGDRRWLRIHRTAPTNWRVWIGRIERVSSSLWFHRGIPMTMDKFETAPAGTIPDSNTQASTICVGPHLIVHVMSSSVAKNIIRRWKIDPRIAPKLCQIWPIVRPVASWPPALDPLRDAEIHFLADQFFNRVMNLARYQAFLKSLDS
jgi:hypothetical protein